MANFNGDSSIDLSEEDEVTSSSTDCEIVPGPLKKPKVVASYLIDQIHCYVGLFTASYEREEKVQTEV